MIDPPFSDGELERLRREHPTCPECRREPWKGHWPWCSKAEAQVRKRYSEYEQRVQYRIQARELGCTCSERLGPYVHRPGCVMYETPEQIAERLDEEHAP